MNSAPNRFLIVDGHAFAYRSFHAIRNLSAPDGFPTNAIFGFIKATGRLRERLHPDYFLVAWDGGLAEARMTLLPEYKAQRPPMPEALEKQIDGMVDYLAAAGLASHCFEGVEADDWIATVARHATESRAEVVIASSDKDFMQLVSDQVRLANPNDKTESLTGVDQVRERTGVAPGQIVDWLSLIGDSVDNIPGVTGVGPKTATELLCQFGAIQSLYAELNLVKSDRLRQALHDSEEQVRRNQELIRLNDRIEREFKLADARIGGGSAPRLGELYKRWGFRSMLAALDGGEARQAELF